MCLASEFTVRKAHGRGAKVDRPLRRAMPIRMRLYRLTLASSRGLLDPPTALFAETLNNYNTPKDGMVTGMSHRLKTACFQASRARSNTRMFLFLCAICAVSLSAAGQSADPSAAREIAKIDGEYSNLSVAKGMPAASVEYFADDGVAFAPAAVNGKKYWAGRTDFPGTLIWQPIFAFAAGAGDLGYTTGVWELKKGNEARSLGFGHYVTVWAKQPKGKWQIALDVGTENPQPSESSPSLQVLPPDVTAGAQPQENSRRSLRTVERQLAEAARDDVGKAILDYATDDIRVYREKSFPAVGLVAARLMLTPEHAKVSFEPGGSKMSSSGDLSYSYGNYSEERGNGVERGIYLMIWRANMNGDWKLALNLQKKLPPAEKK